MALDPKSAQAIRTYRLNYPSTNIVFSFWEAA
jgi:hypothetical protein